MSRSQEDIVRVARLGGLAVSKKQGYMATMGKLGGKSCLWKHGSEFFKEIGKRGGLASAEKKKQLTLKD